MQGLDELGAHRDVHLARGQDGKCRPSALRGPRRPRDRCRSSAAAATLLSTLAVTMPENAGQIGQHIRYPLGSRQAPAPPLRERKSLYRCRREWTSLSPCSEPGTRKEHGACRRGSIPRPGSRDPADAPHRSSDPSLRRSRQDEADVPAACPRRMDDLPRGQFRPSGHRASEAISSTGQRGNSDIRQAESCARRSIPPPLPE